MVFYWSLSDSKSPQISRTLLSILADVTNGLVRMVFTSRLIYKFSSLFTKTLGIVSSAPIAIGITVIMFHRFFYYHLLETIKLWADYLY